MSLPVGLFVLTVGVLSSLGRGLIVICCASRGGLAAGRRRHWIGLRFKICLSLEEVTYGELISYYEVRYTNAFLRLLVGVFVTV